MKRDASEVIAEMRAMATGAHFVEAGLIIEWADELAAAEPADAGRDAVAEAIQSTDSDGRPEVIAWWIGEPLPVGTKLYTRPPSEAAAAVDEVLLYPVAGGAAWIEAKFSEQVDTRSQFEAWCRDCGMFTDWSRWHDSYARFPVKVAWEAWQAALNSQPARSQG